MGVQPIGAVMRSSKRDKLDRNPGLLEETAMLRFFLLSAPDNHDPFADEAIGTALELDPGRNPRGVPVLESPVGQHGPRGIASQSCNDPTVRAQGDLIDQFGDCHENDLSDITNYVSVLCIVCAIRVPS